MTSSFTGSKVVLLKNTSRPAWPFAFAPAPVITYLSSGLKMAFVPGYSVVNPECVTNGFLKARKSQTVGEDNASDTGMNKTKLHTFYGVVAPTGENCPSIY